MDDGIEINFDADGDTGPRDEHKVAAPSGESQYVAQPQAIPASPDPNQQQRLLLHEQPPYPPRPVQLPPQPAGSRFPPDLNDHDLGLSDADEEEAAAKAAQPTELLKRSDQELEQMLSADLYEAIRLKKQRLAEAEAERQRKLAAKQSTKPEIDHVFADMENGFNGMSAASIYWENHWIKQFTSTLARGLAFLFMYLPLILLTYIAVSSCVPGGSCSL